LAWRTKFSICNVAFRCFVLKLLIFFICIANVRERTVVTLKTLGADPGALSDPTPEFRSGRTPADLASANGHKGIAGFLAESSLTSHLSTLTLKDSKVNITDPNQISSPPGGSDYISEENSSQTQPLKDPLSAVRNATQAAARIYQVFRLQSFQRKKVAELDDAKDDINEDPLSLVTVKSATKASPHDVPLHTAAVRIQNKFRGWKGRKEFLIFRQRIVKIQVLFFCNLQNKYLIVFCTCKMFVL
jgi:calmodulin-binding transcription activator